MVKLSYSLLAGNRTFKAGHTCRNWRIALLVGADVGADGPKPQFSHYWCTYVHFASERKLDSSM